MLEGRLSFASSANTPMGAVERKLGLTLAQPLRAHRHDAGVWVSLSEGVGLAVGDH